LRASGFEIRAGRDVIKVSVRFVLLVFEKRQVVPEWMVFGLDTRGLAQRKRGDEILWLAKPPRRWR